MELSLQKNNIGLDFHLKSFSINNRYGKLL